MEATLTKVLTLGNPIVYLGANEGTEWTRGYTFRSYVSFSYLCGRDRVFLNKGSGPTLWIKESGMNLSLDYNPLVDTKDLSDVIADVVAKEALKIVAQSEIVISDARDMSLQHAYRRLKVTHNGKFNGWSFNEAVVHYKYFE